MVVELLLLELGVIGSTMRRASSAVWATRTEGCSGVDGDPVALSTPQRARSVAKRSARSFSSRRRYLI